MDSQPSPVPQSGQADSEQPPCSPDLGKAGAKRSSAERASGRPDPAAPADAAPPAESRTREYLANERTYLSWMRTAISIMGIGVILGRLQAFHGALVPSPERIWQLGIIFAIVGIITVFLATQHYLAVRREITDDNTVEAGRWVILFSMAALLLGGGIVYYVLVYSPHR